ncbi:MAG TPA: phytoene/squalene synthase family protein [Patescibacteria group bacterium]|nr:phytoene/squalene synthase family protein [Patescibacteria group bacterium]
MTSPLMAEAVTAVSRHARTFWLAARFLPAAVRQDVILLYLVCRTLDDLVDDGDPSAPRRLEEVAAWAAGGRATGREELILEHLRERHPAFPLDAVTDFIAGQRQDLGPMDIRTEADLNLYAYRVAGTVGRMMSAVLGATAPQADGAARALGIALQRTNILRDVEEDRARGRTYLPRESFELAAGDRVLQMRIEISIAEHWYERGLAGVRYLPQGGRVVRGAAQMYRAILSEVARTLDRPEPRSRAVVPARRKLRILAGEMLRFA